MKTATVAALCLAVAGTVQAQQYTYTSAPWFALNQGSNADPPARKDIQNMGNEEYTLFVLAMREWQKSGQNVVSGYHQVCGIHGAPHAYWDVNSRWPNFQYDSRNPEGYWDMGYCFHNTQLFYLWHRPYLALFEQQMIAVAKRIASTWYQPQRAAYVAAANSLRLPYWDWAKGTSPGAVPNSISQTTITVGNPANGQQQPIPNPLYSHTLVTGQNAVLDYMRNGGRAITVGRQSPTLGVTYRSTTYQNDMRAQGAQLQRWVAQLLNTAVSCWNTFVTYDTNERSQCRGSQPSVQSLEGIHNTVHNTVCGTMCNLDTAAYDPIFWLHHCNVDRIGALFQVLNPSTRVQPTVVSGGNWVSNANVNRNENFDFKPFRWENGNTSWWKPVWLYDERNSGYTYPELKASGRNANSLRNIVRGLYGTGFTQLAVATGSNSKVKRSAERRALLQYRQAVAESPANLTVPPPPEALAPIADTLLSSQNNSFDEYDVYVKIDKSVSPGKSFNFHCFFGDPPKDANTHSQYLSAPNRAGGFAISVSGSSAYMGGMTAPADGIVPVTDGLLHMVLIGNLRDMTPKRVRGYLRSKLTWRIIDYQDKDLTESSKRGKLVKIRINHSKVTPSGPDPNARPIVAAPDNLIDTLANQTSASALPSGVAATTVATVPGSAETGAGPVPITPDGKNAQAGGH